MLYPPDACAAAAQAVFLVLLCWHGTASATATAQFPAALLLPLPGRSYSQACEDLYAYRYWFADTQPAKGYFVELGALDGVKYSNTLFFEEALGWSGMLIEANPANFARLCGNCRKAWGVHAAVCNQTQAVHFAQGSEDAVGGILEFMSKQHARRWVSPKLRRKMELVTCAPLGALLETAGVNHVQFLSLDVEGAELDVLRTINWRAVQIDVAAVENGSGQAVKMLMQENGMRHVGRVAQNDWYARKGLTPNVTSMHPLTKAVEKHCQALRRKGLPRPRHGNKKKPPGIPDRRAKAPAGKCGRCLKVNVSETTLSFWDHGT